MILKTVKVLRRRGIRVMELEKVDKADKYNRKLVELFEDRDWTRDNFAGNFSDVKTVYDTVDELIQDLLTERDQIRDELDSVLDEFGESKLEQLEEKNFGGSHGPTHRQYKVAFNALSDNMQRVDEFQAYQKELMRKAAEKLMRISGNYRDDFVGSDVAQHTLDKVEDKMEDRFEVLEEKVMRRLESEIGGTEKVVDAARNEVKLYRRFHEELISYLPGHIVESLKDELGGVDGLAELPSDGRGSVDLSGDAVVREERSDELDEVGDAVSSVEVVNNDDEEKDGDEGEGVEG